MFQGEIWWIKFAGRGSEPKGVRPAVILQADRFNQTQIATTIVAPITTNLLLAAHPGNVRLHKGEANLPRPSVVNVSQISVIDKHLPRKHIGNLSPDRLHEILSGAARFFGII